MTWFANWPIRRKLLVPGLAALLVLVLVITVFWAERYSRALNEAFTKDIRLIESYLSPPLMSAAWNFDDDLAAETLRSLSDYQGFVFASLLADGSAFAEHRSVDEVDPAWADAGKALVEGDGTRVGLGDLEIIRTPLIMDENPVGDLIWGVDMSFIRDEVYSANKMAAMIGVASYIAFAGVLFLISLSVSAPMTRVVGRLEDLQKGDTDIDIPELRRRDEVGAIGKALAKLRESTIEKERMTAERVEHEKEQEEVVEQLSAGLSALAQGDLTAEIHAEFPAQYEQLKQDFNTTSEQLRDTVSAVVDAVRDIHFRSTELSNASENLARRTESQAATLEQSTAAIGQVTDGLHAAAGSSSNVENSMRDTKVAAERGGDVLGRTVSAMGEIESSSNQITQITGVIDEIAFQTNLLALNARVEAARAGSVGVGFSVVASEVQSLAQRSADQAAKIKSLIETSANHVTDGVTLVNETGKSLEDILRHINGVFGLNTEMSEGLNDQSARIGEVNSAMLGLDQVTQQNATMAEESTAASYAVTESASNLLGLVQRFKMAPEGYRDALHDEDRSAEPAPHLNVA